MAINIQIQNTSRHLSVRPVLDNGFVIHAWAYSDGVRVVTFEDHVYSFEDKRKMINGKGVSFSLALTKSINNYYRNSNNKKIYVSSIKGEFIEQLNSKVDLWLTKHHGTLKCVLDEDGTILVTLEGYIDPRHHHSRIVLEGTGRSFYGATANALSQYRHYQEAVEVLANSYL